MTWFRKRPKAPLAVAAVGVGGMLVGRAGVILSALAAIAVTIVFLVPLATWTHRHTARYPDGADLIKQSSTSDIYLRGEWEGTARTTVRQLGIVTIVLAGSAMAIFALLELRRRRGIVPPLPPPPPEVVTGGNIAGQR